MCIRDSLMTVLLADTVATRSMEFFAENKVGNYEPIAAERYQYIGRTNVPMYVFLLVYERQSKGQVEQSKQFYWNFTGIFRICPIFQVGSAQFKCKIPMITRVNTVT